MPTFPDQTPVLEDGVVTLRAHTVSDAPRLIEACRDAETRRWMPMPEDYDERNAVEFVERAAKRWSSHDDEVRTWAIDVDGRWLGNIALHDPRGDTLEVGFMTHPDARGKGLCRRAVLLLAAYAFDALGVSGLTWQAARGNFASRRVAWACGFSVDGMWPVPHPVSDGRSVEGVWFGHLGRDDVRHPSRPWYLPPVLQGARITLREWRDDDIPRQEPDEVSAHFVEDMQPSRASYAQWLLTRRERMAEGGGIYWCIADADIDEPLGYIHLQRLHIDFTHGTGDLGYWLHPGSRGLGLAQEAIDLVIEHAFAPTGDDLSGRNGLGLHRLQAGTDIANRASARTLRRSGFRQIATEREVLTYGERPPVSALAFELLASDDRITQAVVPAIVPTLRTDRLVLRAWTERDRPADDVELDRAALQYMPVGAQPTAGTYDEWFARRGRQNDTGQYGWCIADAVSDLALGSVALFDRDDVPVDDHAELGYWLYSGHRGAGYAGEAIDAVLAYAFAPAAADGLGLTRVEAETDAENTPSQKLLTDRGFRQWGRATANYTRADGSVTDSSYFELLAGTYAPTKS